MTTILTRLLEQRTQLEADAEPLREQLARCDSVIEESDKAQQHRDRLLERHDRTTADCIAAGRGVPPIDPELDQAEITLRRAKSSERGAIMAREQIQRELGVINEQLATVAGEIDEAIWLAVPSAACHLFVAAEEARKQYERALAALDSVAAHAYEVAHRSGNGILPEATPAGRCHQTFRAMLANETGLRSSP